jgi:hypothetical protein
LLEELQKPKGEQKITVDHAIEALDGCDQLAKRGIITKAEVSKLCRIILLKFKVGLLKSTVEPRKLVRIARAVERGDITREAVREQLRLFETQKSRTIEEIYKILVEDAEFAHQTLQVVFRLTVRIREIRERNLEYDEDFVDGVRELVSEARVLLNNIPG